MNYSKLVASALNSSVSKNLQFVDGIDIETNNLKFNIYFNDTKPNFIKIKEGAKLDDVITDIKGISLPLGLIFYKTDNKISNLYKLFDSEYLSLDSLHKCVEAPLSFVLSTLEESDDYMDLPNLVKIRYGKNVTRLGTLKSLYILSNYQDVDELTHLSHILHDFVILGDDESHIAEVKISYNYDEDIEGYIADACNYLEVDKDSKIIYIDNPDERFVYSVLKGLQQLME